MTKKSITAIAGVAIAATLLLASVSCSDDKGGGDAQSYLTVGKESRPAWTVAADLYATFEYTMSVQLTLQDILLPYASDDDLMCAVVDGEVRAVTALQRTGGQVYFPLVIAGSSNSGKVSISYYCSNLKRVYTVSDWQPYQPGFAPSADGKPYVINFIPAEE